MEEQHKIIRQVYAAKEDVKEADLLISTYMPFIKAETAKFLKGNYGQLEAKGGGVLFWRANPGRGVLGERDGWGN